MTYYNDVRKQENEELKQKVNEITSMFTEEDKKFNRKMMKRGIELSYGKKKRPSIFQDRQYDFSSEILGDFRKKWGIPEETHCSPPHSKPHIPGSCIFNEEGID